MPTEFDVEPRTDTVTALHTALILRWFILRRQQFGAALSSQHSGLSQRKYFRLFFLAISEATIVAIGQMYLIIESLRESGLQPYNSWAEVHSNFSTINFVPMNSNGNTADTIQSVEVLRWLSLFPGIALFIFFGLTQDAKSAYSDFGKKAVTVLQRYR